MPKILIVENSEEGRDALAARLQCRGFDVVIADDGKIGIAMVESEKPDLVVMDMNMPVMDGWEATRRIKANNGIAGVPIIALTERALPGDRARALGSGCADSHSKPVEFPELLGQIESILHKCPAPEPLVVAPADVVPKSQ